MIGYESDLPMQYVAAAQGHYICTHRITVHCTVTSKLAWGNDIFFVLMFPLTSSLRHLHPFCEVMQGIVYNQPPTPHITFQGPYIE